MKDNPLLHRIKNIVLDSFKEEDIEIILFGSRARGDNTPYSDVDIALLPQGKGKNIQKKITLLRYFLEESNIPYKVEIIDLSSASKSFREQVLKEGIIWRN